MSDISQSNSAPEATRSIRSYISTLFDTDARIIATNDTHVVVALTFPKSWLRKNHHLLAALSEATVE